MTGICLALLLLLIPHARDVATILTLLTQMDAPGGATDDDTDTGERHQPTNAPSPLPADYVSEQSRPTTRTQQTPPGDIWR